MMIQLGRIVIHHLLRILHRVRAVQVRSGLIRLFFWVFIGEEVFDLSFTRRSRVDGEARGELSVGADLDRV